MALVPHERSLVQRLQDKPFALIGVNLDFDSEVLQRVQQDKEINWRSFWDDGRKIASRWGVSGIPHVVVLDAKGVVRYRPEGGLDLTELEAVIDKLVAETR
jgi:hypothetical protein